MQTDRKYSSHSHQTYISASRGLDQPTNSNKGLEDLECKHSVEGEKIVGFSWFHQNGKEIVSVSKKNKDQNLRYFATK